MKRNREVEGRIVRRTTVGARPPSFSRYDAALVAIPLAYLLALLAGVLFSPELRTALTAASLLAAVVVGDALFLNPPSAGGRGREGDR